MKKLHVILINHVEFFNFSLWLGVELSQEGVQIVAAKMLCVHHSKLTQRHIAEHRFKHRLEIAAGEHCFHALGDLLNERAADGAVLELGKG